MTAIEDDRASLAGGVASHYSFHIRCTLPAVRQHSMRILQGMALATVSAELLNLTAALTHDRHDARRGPDATRMVGMQRST
ncbi:hypothetical protein GGR60_002243 [Xanthomonas arboricola]|uniref:hypothetical protein n=1 Tax=Xanthomonas euroxanthea TaxID=2259622 RepID=UPI0014301265|nr:hypothetical protein [Xanthomonas euroxanthea]NJC37708.1 hypothetical protein [Xanthomonas euroxanthea]